MNRVRVLGFLVGALAVAAFALPASALASTYTWDLARDFTATAPGANPDHDPYGGTPWSYQEGPSGGSTTPSTFSPLGTFAVTGGLATWTDAAAGSSVVGDNPTANPITDGTGASIQPGIYVEPGDNSQAAVVGWASPFGETTAVSINGSISAESPISVCYNTSWTLEDDGTVLQSGLLGGISGTSSPIGLSPVSVAAGTSIDLVVSSPPADAGCDATAIALEISANGTAPAPTVTTPAPGSSTTLTSPTFSGAAGSDFGDGSQVTLNVYSGQTASGSPVQAVTVARAGAGWSATLGSALALGTYTVQAEQADILGDVGFSVPLTFTVSAPSVGLDSLGSAPQTTSTPTFTGTADLSTGADPFVVVEVWSGTTATGAPTQTLTGSFTGTGQFSVPVSPALPDGTYTAMAEQGDTSGNTGVSAPQTFSIDTHAPTVTLVSPAKGSRADSLQLAFNGGAGDQSFDSGVVTVSLYKGRKATGKAVGTVKANVKGATWSTTWTKTLSPAVYTAVASQTDAVGHVGTSTAHTFTLVPLPPVIGSFATIKSGRVSVNVSCNEQPGDTCTGNVLVLTRGMFQPKAGGAVGRLTIMFAYVRVLGGHTTTITRTVLAPVLAALRGHGNVAVTLSANLRPAKGKAIHASTRGKLRHT